MRSGRAEQGSTGGISVFQGVGLRVFACELHENDFYQFELSDRGNSFVYRDFVVIMINKKEVFMKISDRNTALHFLSDTDPMLFSVKQGDQGVKEAERLLVHDFPAMRPHLRQRIQYVSRPFMNAYLKGKEKLKGVFFEEPIEQSGTLIVPNEGHRNITIFYTVSASCDRDGVWTFECMIVSFYNHREYKRPILFSLIRNTFDYYWVFNEEHLIRHGLNPRDMVEEVVGLVIFMKFCELKTKVVEAGKHTIHVGQKYVNESNQAVEILDSTWFTTIVRTEGFMVGGETGGFFRLQPHGPGLTQKKLVWIFPFQKHGYTRKAKMLRE